MTHAMVIGNSSPDVGLEVFQQIFEAAGVVRDAFELAVVSLVVVAPDEIKLSVDKVFGLLFLLAL